MDQPDPKDRDDREGTGALCSEAQADGVPCFEIGKDCAICERAAAAKSDETDGSETAETS